MPMPMIPAAVSSTRRIEAAGDALRLGDGYGTTLTMSRCAWVS
jgi:hypothetical protein